MLTAITTPESTTLGACTRGRPSTTAWAVVSIPGPERCLNVSGNMHCSLRVLLTTSGLRESLKAHSRNSWVERNLAPKLLLGFSLLWIVRNKPQSVRQRCLAGCARWARILGGPFVVEIGRSGRPVGHRRKIVLYFCAHVEDGKLGNSQ